MRREQYYFKIQVYKKRRKEYRRRYYNTKDERYLNWFRGLTKKIASWNRAIRRIDKRNERLFGLIRKVNKYFGLDIRKRNNSLRFNLARNIYYKVALECGTIRQSTFIGNAIGRKRQVVKAGRISLQKSFATQPENKKTFHDFKEYIEREETDATERRA